MKTVYVTPVGTASLIAREDYLKWAAKEFSPSLFILLGEKDRAMSLMDKFSDANIEIVLVDDAIYGCSDYKSATDDIVDLISRTNTDTVVINSSGGTEKMSSIVREVAKRLSSLYKIKEVWGYYDKYLKNVTYYNKPIEGE